MNESLGVNLIETRPTFKRGKSAMLTFKHMKRLLRILLFKQLRVTQKNDISSLIRCPQETCLVGSALLEDI